MSDNTAVMNSSNKNILAASAAALAILGASTLMYSVVQ
jgi:hypothetical protein